MQRAFRKGDGSLNPDGWWDWYLSDPEFRLRQEVAGYGAQLAYLLRRDRNHRREHVLRVVDALVGPLYGRMVDRKTATKLVLEAARA